MFGNNDGQQQPNNSNGLGAPSPSFPTSMPSPAPSSDSTAPLLQDLSVPELTATNEPATPSASPWTPPASTAPTASTDDLVQLKQQALTQLSPIVGKLDQTPEEKFRTTMMMIQASDDQSLIRSAYDAAQAITDEKVKAQALLDVINEINYFSQKNQQA